MSKYKCLKTFTSATGPTIYYGTKVNFKAYAALPYSEQNNFSLIRDTDASIGYVESDEGFNHASDLDISRED